jgi:hypothetical protein
LQTALAERQATGVQTALLAYRGRCAKQEHCGDQKTVEKTQSVFITDTEDARFRMAVAAFFSSAIFY